MNVEKTKQITALRPWYLRIGPSLITACVVIGPGSVFASSQVGAAEGYSRNWIILAAALFMMVYMSLGAKLGAATKQSPGTLIANRAGRPAAVLIGVSIFLIAALFQFGNNLGVHTAMISFVDGEHWALPLLWIVPLNALLLAFVFGFRDLYKALERLMMVFVAIMLLAFAANLALARPNPLQLLRGFVPSWSSDMDISVLGLVGTTFVIAAAFFQTYLVQQKGWGKNDVRQGVIDARVGTTVMLLITLMIVSTSAAVFYEPIRVDIEAGTAKAVQLQNVGQVAEQLKPLLGEWGKIVFCCGLFSAAYSSFLVNSMVGGVLLSDGLGLGSRPDQRWPRIFTASVLVIGMCVALAMITLEVKLIPMIIFGQALVVLAAPLLAIVMLWLTNVRSVMGEDRNGTWTNVAAAGGLILLLIMAYITAAYAIPKNLSKLRPAPPVIEAPADQQSQTEDAGREPSGVTPAE